MTVLLVLTSAFVVVVLTCLPIYLLAKSGRLERNGAIGIKTQATLASDEAWRRGHKAAAPWILSTTFTALTAVAGCVALALFVGDSVSNLAISVIVFLGFGGVMGNLVAAAVVASRAAHGKASA